MLFCLQVYQLLLDGTAVYFNVTVLLDKQVAAATASSCHRSALSMHLAHMQLAVQRVMQLQSLKSGRISRLLLKVLGRISEVAAGGQPADGDGAGQALAAVLGMLPGQGPMGPDKTSITSPDQPGTSGPDSIARSANATEGWEVTLDSIARALGAGTQAWSKAVLQLQEEILQRVEVLGKAALANQLTAEGQDGTGSFGQQRDGSSSSVSGGGEATAAGVTAEGSSAGGISGTAAAIQPLLEQLPEVLKSVSKDAAAAEMAEVLQALFRAEFARGYGDLPSFMAGHLHMCPNAHVYMIGECGGAMQRSRCPECGAVVGGAGHHLAAGNQGADQDLLQQLREEWAAGASSNDRG